MKYSKLALALAFSTTTLFLTACSDNDGDDSLYAPTPSLPSTPEHYVSEQTYDLDSLDEAASIKVLNYKMPNVTGTKTVETSALVMFPKTVKPNDGYRVVVWAHGTVGVADKCAPSKNPLNPNFKDYTAKNLLAAGYVVIAPDYEGLGDEANVHPYLNIPSEAESAIYAIKAAKEKYGSQLNGAWMSVGQSQGGQASLGIAEFANADANYKGAVAGAPASSLGTIILQVAPAALTQMEQLEDAYNVPIVARPSIETYATLLSYAALAGAGMTAYEPDFDYGDIFKGDQKAKELAKLADTECLGEMVDAYKADIIDYLTDNPTAKVTSYAGIDEVEFQQNATVQKFLQSYSQPTTAKLDKPILIIQGEDDTNVPHVITQGLYMQMKASGTDVELISVPKAGHTQAIVWNNADMVNFVKSKMPVQ